MPRFPDPVPALDADIPPALRGPGKLWALLRTSRGNLVVDLFEAQVPRTVGNFVGLATGFRPWTDPHTGANRTDPLYDGTHFHRVVPEFMVQGGDPLGDGTGGPGYDLAEELRPDLRHDRPGILSMANAGATNGSQFFITEVAAPWLDGRHTVFGLVVAGLEILPRISNSPRDAEGRPRTPVVLKAVEISRGTHPPRR